ncbi:MAG: 4Fe-4S binding protein [Rikenellaceae bacterium]|jgi:Na+-translocating ferredoxin:NAD+ oxidoreductase RNF subunit RnfB|nr:4Fe-4S binding protein [Rikenellaceae bacterium]
MMMNNNYRALDILTEVCRGCAHCMRVCPTEALRVAEGKAVLHADWCIDCGECFRECPVRAIRVRTDDYHDIFNYRHRVLLVPELFFGQFSERVSREMIYSVIGELGFTEVCAVEQSVDTLIDEINTYMESAQKPVISSFCPAVVRLIQVRFPSLVDHIMRLMPPIEITARYYQTKYMEQGGDPEELGLFYLSPCIGKIASVKSPVGGYTSPITGVINMDFLYNKVYLAYKQHAPVTASVKVNGALSAKGVLYSTTGGESRHVRGRMLAVDGMKNVVDFLELLENEKIKGVEFLELRACDESCAGGILSHRNRFLGAESQLNYAKTLPQSHALVDDYKKYGTAVIRMKRIEPRSMVKYDQNLTVAFQKMEQAKRVEALLPHIDCGACGAPSCEALAGDIARGEKSLAACLFLPAMDEEWGDLAQHDEGVRMEQVWGKGRFNR